MEGLIKSLPEVLRGSGNAQEVAEAAVIAAWKHVAGDGLKEHAVPLTFQERTLKVAVADAIWQRQLHLMRGQMLFRVNSLLGQPLVGAIEFVVDPEVVNTRVEVKQDVDAALDNEAPIELWSAANAIQDKKLRQTFLRAAMSSIRRRD
jgi:hypothetical protein